MCAELNSISEDINKIIARISSYKNRNYTSLRKKEQLDDLTEGSRYLQMGLLKVSKIAKVNQEENSNEL